MKTNMGSIDRVVRIVIAAVVAGLYFTNILTGTVAIVLLAISGIFVLTSFVSFCPIYAIFGMNSCAVKKQE